MWTQLEWRTTFVLRTPTTVLMTIQSAADDAAAAAAGAKSPQLSLWARERWQVNNGNNTNKRRRTETDRHRDGRTLGETLSVTSTTHPNQLIRSTSSAAGRRLLTHAYAYAHVRTMRRSSVDYLSLLFTKARTTSIVFSPNKIGPKDVIFTLPFSWRFFLIFLTFL